MSRNRDYLWQLALTLQHHRLIPCVTEEMIQQICERLHTDRSATTTQGVLAVILGMLVPQRCVEYDSEIDNCDETLPILRDYARATQGEWIPADTWLVTRAPTAGEGWQDTLSFECKGVAFCWQFAIADETGHGTRWPGDFYQQLAQVWETHLQGTFLDLFLGHQGVFDCYLPREAATDLMQIITEISGLEPAEAIYDVDGFETFIADLSHRA